MDDKSLGLGEGGSWVWVCSQRSLGESHTGGMTARRAAEPARGEGQAERCPRVCLRCWLLIAEGWPASCSPKRPHRRDWAQRLLGRRLLRRPPLLEPWSRVPYRTHAEARTELQAMAAALLLPTEMIMYTSSGLPGHR